MKLDAVGLGESRGHVVLHLTCPGVHSTDCMRRHTFRVPAVAVKTDVNFLQPATWAQ
jgi:hypothetical protein